MRFALSGLALCAAVTAIPLHPLKGNTGLTGGLQGLTNDIPVVDGVKIGGIDARAIFVPEVGQIHKKINHEELVKDVENQAHSASLPVRRGLVRGAIKKVKGLGSTGSLTSEVEGVAPEIESSTSEVEGAEPEGLVPATDGLNVRSVLPKVGSVGKKASLKKVTPTAENTVAQVEDALPSGADSAEAENVVSEVEGALPATEGVSPRGLLYKAEKEIKGLGLTSGTSELSGLTGTLPTRGLIHKIEKKVKGLGGLPEVNGVQTRSLRNKASGLVSKVEGAANTDGVLSSVEGAAQTNGALSPAEGSLRRRKTHFNNGLPTGVSSVPNVNYVVSEVEAELTGAA